MKRLFQVLFALLPFLATTTIAAPSQKNPPAKHVVKQVKKSAEKKTPTKKTVNKKSVEKKSVEKKSVEKKSTKKSAVNKAATPKKSAPKADKKLLKKSTKVESSKSKTIKKAERTKATAQKVREKKPADTKIADKKVEKTENNIQKAAPLSQAKKLVVVPKCQDKQVFNVLSDAFKQQGNATGTQMTVKQINQARETQHYPQQGIRSCHALVETNGKKYQTDYSVILNGNGFFVQVENAQAMF